MTLVDKLGKRDELKEMFKGLFATLQCLNCDLSTEGKVKLICKINKVLGKEVVTVDDISCSYSNLNFVMEHVVEKLLDRCD